MRPTEKIKQFIGKASISSNPNVNKAVLNELTDEMERTKQTGTGLDMWRIFMKSPVTKLAAAAAIIMVIGLVVVFLDHSNTVAYAFEQTRVAVEDIRYFHFKSFGNPPDSNLSKEAWVEYSPTGKVKNVRFDVYDKGRISQSVAWKEGKTEVWSRDMELKFFEDENYTAKILFFASRYNPRGAIDYLYSLEKEGKVKIEIQEPATKLDDILATVIYEPNTYLLERKMPAMKDVYRIDNATRLAKAVEIFKLDPNGTKPVGVWKYCDYNEPFAPEIFDLNKEASSDVNRVDIMTMDIGIEKGNLSNSAIMAEVVRQFLEALIHKDYALAGKLVSHGLSEQEAKQNFGNFCIVEVISIGEPKLDGDFGNVPFKAVFEKDGKRVEQNYVFPVRQALGHPTRWAIGSKESY
jgi:hypothetical protein